MASIELSIQWAVDLVRHLKLVDPKKFKTDPVEQFRQHVWVNPYPHDNFAELETTIGIERIMSGSDFPHSDALPEPAQYLKALSVYGTDDVRKIMRENGEPSSWAPTLDENRPRLDDNAYRGRGCAPLRRTSLGVDAIRGLWRYGRRCQPLAQEELLDPACRCSRESVDDLEFLRVLLLGDSSSRHMFDPILQIEGLVSNWYDYCARTLAARQVGDGDCHDIGDSAIPWRHCLDHPEVPGSDQQPVPGRD